MTNLPNSGQANSLDNFNVDRADYRQSMENLLAFLAQGLGGVTGAYGTQAVDPAAIKLSGLPTAPTAAPGTNTTQLATTAFVKAAADAATGPWSRTGTVLAPKTAGDVVSVSAGTAAAPGLAIAGDPNTGLFSPGADTLALSTGGVDRVHVTPDGKVGIGTLSPGAKLEVAGGDISLVNNAGLSVAVSAHTIGVASVAFGFNDSAATNAFGAPPKTAFLSVAQSFPLILGAGALEKLRVSNDGYVRLAAGTPGIQFNGDTAAANALNDYEEGVFTPGVAGDGTPGTATITSAVGQYVKIGKLCTVHLVIGWTGFTGTGAVTVTGLPFQAGSVRAAGAVAAPTGIPLTSNESLSCLVLPSTSIIQLYKTLNGSYTGIPCFPAGSFFLSVTYTTAA